MKTRYGGGGRLGQGLGSILGALLGGDTMRQAGQRDAALAAGGGGAGGGGLGQYQLMAGLTGLDLPKVQQLGDLVATGGWGPGQEMAGPLMPGEARPMQSAGAPEWFTPEIKERLNLGLMALGLQGMGSPAGPDKLGDLLLSLNKFGAVQRGAEGQMPPESLAASYGAIAGKPNYNQGSQGVMNQYTGALDMTPLVAAKLMSEGALAGARGASAGASRARAGVYDAQAQAVREGRPAGRSGGAGKASAAVQMLDYLVQNGMPIDQALRLQATAKMNPLKATTDLAKEIMAGNKSKPSGARVTPEQAMEQARSIVAQFMDSALPGAGGGADDDPLDLLE